jgi:hypothetical protein
VVLLTLAAAASDLPYVQQGRPNGRGDPDRPTMEPVWKAELPQLDVPPPYGTIVQTWYINSGRSYDGAGIVWVVDSNRFYTVGQGLPSGQSPKVYSFDPANPTGTLRDEAWTLTQPNLGGASQDLPWGIGYDPDSACWWLTWLPDGGISNPCHAVRFMNKAWRGLARDTWSLRNLEPPNWYSTFDKREDDVMYFIAHHVYSTLSAARFYKADPYAKASRGYYSVDVPTVSERAACWVGDTWLHMSTGGWNQSQFIARDSTGRVRTRASCGSLASNDIWAPIGANPDSTVWMFATYNDGSNTVLKVSTGLTHGRLPTRARHNVGVRGILAPAGTVDSGQAITPQAVVRNMGRFDESFSVFMTIGSSYSDSQYVTTLPAGRTDTVDFNVWTADTRDSLDVVSWTVCLTDSFPRDDTSAARFLVRVKDVAVVGIIQPVDTVDSGTVMYPQAWLWNHGNQSASFPVQFRIGTYTSTANVVNLIPGGQRLVEAPDAWTAIPGVYDHRVTALLAGDLRPDNNSMTARVVVPGLVTRDVGVVSIDNPVGAVDTTMTFAPEATVHNWGTAAATFWTWFTMTGPAGLAYSESLQAMLAGGGELQLTFPATKCTIIGSYNMVCSTYYSGDQVDTNNVKREHLWVFGRLAGDIGVVQIMQPAAMVDTGEDITPQARWHNYSSTEATSFTAYAILYNPAGSQVYLEDSNVTLLAPGTDIDITFPLYNVGTDTGWWVCRCSTYAPGDTVLVNNVLDKRFQVMAAPPWLPGWHEVQSVPAAPSTKALKDGAWLTMDVSSGLIYAAKGNKTSDFYKYDAQADTNGEWTQLTNWPNGTEGKLPSKGANGCPDFLGHVYATKGNNTQGFWRYNTDSLTWAQMPVVPMGASMKRVKGGTDMVYVTEGDTGYVYLLKGYKQDFFRFNAMSGVWDTSLPQAPAGLKPKWDKGSWLVHDGLTTLYAHKAKYHELWTFDLTTHTWATAALPGMPLSGMMGKSKKSKDGGSAAYYDGAIYALKGGNTQEWWKYQIDSARWTELETIPAFGSTAKKKRVKGGGDVTSYGGGYFFAFKGNKTLEHWRYGLPQPVYGFRPHGGVMAQPVSRRSDLTVQPNPVTRGWAELSYSLPQAGPVRVTVYDITGRGVAGGNFVAGRSGTARLDLRQLSSGVYLVKVSAPGVTLSRKLIVQ